MTKVIYATVYESEAGDSKLNSGVWRSLVSRLVRDQEAPGSNPGTPTNYSTPMFTVYDPSAWA